MQTLINSNDETLEAIKSVELEIGRKEKEYERHLNRFENNTDRYVKEIEKKREAYLSLSKSRGSLINQCTRGQEADQLEAQTKRLNALKAEVAVKEKMVKDIKDNKSVKGVTFGLSPESAEMMDPKMIEDFLDPRKVIVRIAEIKLQSMRMHEIAMNWIQKQNQMTSNCSQNDESFQSIDIVKNEERNDKQKEKQFINAENASKIATSGEIPSEERPLTSSQAARQVVADIVEVMDQDRQPTPTVNEQSFALFNSGPEKSQNDFFGSTEPQNSPKPQQTTDQNMFSFLGSPSSAKDNESKSDINLFNSEVSSPQQENFFGNFGFFAGDSSANNNAANESFDFFK